MPAITPPPPHPPGDIEGPQSPRKGLGFPSAIVDTIAGLCAGACGTVMGHPLDMVKTRLQGSLDAIRSAVGTATLTLRSGQLG